MTITPGTKAHSNFIFVVRRERSDGVEQARSARELTADRFRAGTWPLNQHTKHQQDLEEGDSFVVYAAGGGDADRKHLIAMAEVAGSRFRSSRAQGNAGSWAASLRPPLFDVPIRHLQWFPQPVATVPIVERLLFIRNKANWKNYFQGAIIRIADSDFSLITELGLSQGLSNRT